MKIQKHECDCGYIIVVTYTSKDDTYLVNIPEFCDCCKTSIVITNILTKAREQIKDLLQLSIDIIDNK